jgi:pimeloyl-ACP methyl ester carboxylesterase
VAKRGDLIPKLPNLRGANHSYIDAGDARLHIAVLGPEDAPPLLLVHGWPQHWWCWRYVAPSLAPSGADLKGF